MAPPIYVGGTEIAAGNLKIGGTDIAEVYVGAQKIWPDAPPALPYPPDFISDPGNFRPIGNSPLWQTFLGASPRTIDYQSNNNEIIAFSNETTDQPYGIFNGLTNITDGWCGANLRQYFESPGYYTGWQLALRMRDGLEFLGCRMPPFASNLQVYHRIGGTFTKLFETLPFEHLDGGYVQVSVQGDEIVLRYQSEGRLNAHRGNTTLLNPGAIGFTARGVAVAGQNFMSNFRAGSGIAPKPVGELPIPPMFSYKELGTDLQHFWDMTNTYYLSTDTVNETPKPVNDGDIVRRIADEAIEIGGRTGNPANMATSLSGQRYDLTNSPVPTIRFPSTNPGTQSSFMPVNGVQNRGIANCEFFNTVYVDADVGGFRLWTVPSTDPTDWYGWNFAEAGSSAASHEKNANVQYTIHRRDGSTIGPLVAPTRNELFNAIPKNEWIVIHHANVDISLTVFEPIQFGGDLAGNNLRSFKGNVGKVLCTLPLTTDMRNRLIARLVYDMPPQP